MATGLVSQWKQKNIARTINCPFIQFDFTYAQWVAETLGMELGLDLVRDNFIYKWHSWQHGVVIKDVITIGEYLVISFCARTAN